MNNATVPRELQNVFDFYGVSLWVGRREEEPPCLRKVGDSPDWLSSAVIYEDDALGVHFVDRDLVCHWEYPFHELVHFILEHPKHEFNLWETFGLLQLERVLAKHFRFPGWLKRRVIDWQLETMTEFDSTLEEALPGYYQCRVWKFGYDLLYRTGVLDPSGRPTGRFARWTDRILYEIEVLRELCV